MTAERTHGQHEDRHGELRRVADNALDLNFIQLVRRVYEQTMADDVIGLSAELAYRFFLALFPFAIFLTALGGLVASQLNIQNPAKQIVQQLGDLLPQGADTLVQSQLEQVINSNSSSVLSISAILALVFAAGGMNAIIKSMNRVYDVPESRPIYRRYPVALLMTLVGGGGMLLAFLLYGPARYFAPQLAHMVGLGDKSGIIVNGVAIVGAVVLVIIAATVVYRLAPNIALSLRTLVPGALLATTGWLIATVVLNIYVTNFGSYANTYGALAGVAVLLIWFYISALVFLVCAELNMVVHTMTAPADLQRRRDESHEKTRRQKGESGNHESDDNASNNDEDSQSRDDRKA